MEPKNIHFGKACLLVDFMKTFPLWIWNKKWQSNLGKIFRSHITINRSLAIQRYHSSIIAKKNGQVCEAIEYCQSTTDSLHYLLRRLRG